MLKLKDDIQFKSVSKRSGRLVKHGESHDAWEVILEIAWFEDVAIMMIPQKDIRLYDYIIPISMDNEFPTIDEIKNKLIEDIRVDREMQKQYASFICDNQRSGSD